MPALGRRFARTSLEELRFRAGQAVHVAFEALQYGCGLQRSGRESLARALSEAAVGQEIGTALHRRDWTAANAALRRHYLERSRFLVTPASRAPLASAVLSRFPGARQEATARASRLLEGRYDLLGYHGLSFARGGQDVNWHFDPVHQAVAPIRFWPRVPYLDPRHGDHKVIWELNRHQHWLALGRAAWLDGNPIYARAFACQLRSWIQANPPLAGINWASMLELAFRSLSWIWALNLFAPFEAEDESGWLVDLLVHLSLQLDHVARHLSRYFSPNTHLLGEGLALYVAGRVLPELARAPRWESTGREILVHGATAQVNPDGGHAELSVHYHRYALDFYLLALGIARRTGDHAANVFQEVADRLASYCREMADESGRLPTIGDDDGGMLFPICGRSPADARDSLGLAAILLDRPDLAVAESPEEIYWLLGGDVPVLPSRTGTAGSRVFPDTGYAVLRSGRDRAIFDVGPHGFMNGGHAHADALSIVLSVAGRPLAIDPGTATYTMDQGVRDRFRSTAMHNTVVVNGRPQSLPAGPFHWRTRADARLAGWHDAGSFVHVEGEHDGYAPLVHRRTLTMAGDGLWIVADHIVGQGTQDADVYWHLAEGWARESQVAGRLRHTEGARAVLVSTAGEPHASFGDQDGLGWHAPVYGRILPALTLRFRARAEAPFTIVTAITGAPSLERLDLATLPALAEQEDGWHRAAVRIARDDAMIVALYATPAIGGAGNPTRTAQHVVADVGELSTDARVAMLRLAVTGEPRSLHLLDATFASWIGRYEVAIRRQTPAQDLHFDQDALRRLSRDVEARPVG